jgi:hypothetical protein
MLISLRDTLEDIHVTHSSIFWLAEPKLADALARLRPSGFGAAA